MYDTHAPSPLALEDSRGQTGRLLQAASRAAEGVKPTILELGSKSANIVFPDVTVASAVNGIIAGIFAAAGQTCLAG